MNRHHKVEQASIENGVLYLTVDGQSIERPLADISPLLAKANPEDQQHFEISPSGYGIHWPAVDEDLSIDGLLGITHQPENSEETA